MKCTGSYNRVKFEVLKILRQWQNRNNLKNQTIIGPIRPIGPIGPIGLI